MFSIFFALSLIQSFNNSPQNLHEGIEVIVGKDPITSTDIELATESLLQGSPADASERAKVKARATKILIDDALIRNYLASNGISVPDGEVDRQMALQLNFIREQQKLESLDQVNEFLKSKGMDTTKLRMKIEHDIENQQFMAYMRSRAHSRSIDDKEYAAYYQNHLGNFQKNQEYLLQECIIPMGSDSDAAEKKALNFVKNPINFQDCVNNTSDGEGKKQDKKSKKHKKGETAENEPGVLGWFKRGVLADNIEEKVFALKQNEVALIKMDGRIQLLRAVKIRDLGTMSPEMAKPLIDEAMRQELTQKEIEAALNPLRTSIVSYNPAK